MARMFLGPYAQCYLCEALEQKWAKRQKYKKLVILVWPNVKIGYKMAELCTLKFGAKVAYWPILGRKLFTFFEIWTSTRYFLFWAMISICKILIYIDSESFRQINWTCRRSRLFGDCRLGKIWDFEI